MIKRLTFVRRADGVDAASFGDRWRDLAVGADAPPSRLVHCVVRPGRTDRPHHGVSIEWFDDEAALDANDVEHGAKLDAWRAAVDVMSMLPVRVNARTVFGQDHLDAWWQTPGKPRLLLLGMIQKSPALSRHEFAEYWWHQHRPLANELLPPAVQPPIYVHDYALEGERCTFDGVGEFYDDSVDVARDRTNWAGDDNGAAERIVADEERFLVRDTRFALITDAEVIIPG